MTLALPISDATIWSVPYNRKTFIALSTGVWGRILKTLFFHNL
jgi:hypothetical protein